VSDEFGGTPGRLSRHGVMRILLTTVSAYGLAVALALGAGNLPAAAKAKLQPKAKESHDIGKEPFGDIPKGPLHIIISINQQRLHLYSNGTLIADAPVSTGVPGHPTPMGVFSVIEKDRHHQSNLYSGAPMPFMQRITWSGVAIHQGPLPGGPASHGCIRMPQDFAARLWVLTKLGARVIIVRNAVAPVAFSDARLFVRRDRPSDSVAAALPAAIPMKTAQALDKTVATDAPVPLAAGRAAAPAPAERALARAGRRAVDAAARAPEAALDLDAAAPPPETAEIEPPTGSIALRGTLMATPALVEALRTTAPLVPVAPPLPISPPPVSQAAAVPDPGTPELPQDPDTAIAPADVTLPPARPDIARILAERAGPVTVFVSRAEGKIFVRQRFAPVLTASVTIRAPDQPLGTHVFTAMDYLEDGASFRWTAVTLPGEPPKAERHARPESIMREEPKGRTKHKAERHPPDFKPPQTAREALGRIEIPPDVVERISAMMVPGSSLILSDHGLGPETGKGTEFIVLTR